MIQTLAAYTILAALLTGGGGGAAATDDTACAAPGRFPDAAAPGCRGYVMCVGGPGGTLARYNLTCPLDFVFNPTDGVCTDSANYRCPSAVTYNCSAEGHFEAPDSEDCRSFVLCSRYDGGALTARMLECPERHLFDPLLATCVNETHYTCGQSQAPPADTAAPSAGYYAVHKVNIVMIGIVSLALRYTNNLI